MDEDVKIFRIDYEGDEWDLVAAYSEEQALSHWMEEGGYEDGDESNLDSITEIPQSEWDNKTLTYYEDNDKENPPFEVSYRDSLVGVVFPAIIASTLYPL